MPECSTVSSVRTNPSCGSQPSPAELGQQLRLGAEKVLQSLGDPTARVQARKGGQQLLEQGTAMLRQLGDGPGATELAAGLRKMESALARIAPDEAASTLPTRSRSPRQQRLANQAERSVNLGALAMARTGDPEDFANAVVGDMSDRHLRALGRLDTEELRATLHDHGFSEEDSNRAIDRVKEKIAGKYQRVIQDRASTAMESNAARLERAMRPGAAEFNALVGQLLGDDGEELLQQFELAGANVSALRTVVAGAGSNDGRATMAQLRQHLPAALTQVVETIREQAEVVSAWGNEELYEEAAASEAFPQVAGQVRQRWAIDGVVGQGVAENIASARADAHLEHQVFNGVLIAAAAIGSACTGGAVGLAITASGAMVREGVAVRGAWADADLAAAGASSGIVPTEDAAEARTRAQIESAAAAGAVGAELAASGIAGKLHHEVEDALGTALGRAAMAGIEGGVAVGIEEGKHAGVVAAMGDDHH